MHEITVIQYKSGSEAILYSKCELITEDIERAVFRIIWDSEFEKLQSMPSSQIAKVVNNILNNKWIFDED